MDWSIDKIFVIASDWKERSNLTYVALNQRLLRRYAPRNDDLVNLAKPELRQAKL
jgi:hypothetical protein